MIEDETKEKIKLIKKWVMEGYAPPYAISLSPTDLCNLECLFCGRGTKVKTEELSEKKLIAIVNEAAGMGVKVVNVSGGGEPFFYPKKTFNMLKTIKSYGMGGGFTTNGTLFNEKIIRGLVEIQWDAIFFSVDGPDAETHDFLRNKKGVFKKVVHTLRRFLYWKKKLKKNNPLISFQTVLVNKNYKKIGRIIELAAELGVERVILIPVIPRNEWGEKLRLSEKQMVEFQQYIEIAKRVAEELNITTNLDDFADPRLITQTDKTDEVIMSNKSLPKNISIAPCLEPWLTLTIYADGRIGPCEQNVGNSSIRNRSLKEVWYHDKFLNKIRSQFNSGKLCETCKKCCEPIMMRNKILKEEVISQISGITFSSNSSFSPIHRAKI